MPNLKVKDNGKDFIHQVDGDFASIGRAETNTVAIGDHKSSKEHCRVERFGNRWKLIDLESKNGTRVNGHFRNKAWLSHGDTIQIGKAELRFGVEGGARTTRSAAPAAAAKTNRARRPEPKDARSRDYDEEGYEDELPARSRYGKSGNDKLIIAGAVLLGGLLIFIVASKMAASMSRDTHNLNLITEAEKYKRRGEWREALAFLLANADPQGSAYPEVLKEIKILEGGMEDQYRRVAEGAARVILSKLSRRVKAYNQGKQRAQPEEILQLVQTLKTKYPGTESTQTAKKEFRAWFAGKVPQRASEIMAGGSQLQKDWQEAEDQQYEYIKQWRFREARETIEVFLTAREAVLDGDDLQKYKQKVSEALQRISLQADGIYRARQRVAWDYEKKKRWDDAIRVYKDVIEKFGIDAYVRKAQEEINKIKAKKKG